jgi:hypothetical protein
MNDHDERLRQPKKPELTDADKALLEAEPDWSRMGQGAKRLLNTTSSRAGSDKAAAPKKQR